MNPLHMSPPVRQGLGSCLRPGGLTLTRRMLELASPADGAMVLDAGCGSGTTVAYLLEQGMEHVVGIDLDSSLLASDGVNNGPLVQADLIALPLLDRTLDLIICECCWNLTDRPRVLAEFVRVLRPGGRLCLSDIYNRSRDGGVDKSTWPIPSCLSFATDLDTVEKEVRESGFVIEACEDHTALLTHAAAEFVFIHGSLHGFWLAVTGEVPRAEQACTAAVSARPGLFLIIARRE